MAAIHTVSKTAIGGFRILGIPPEATTSRPQTNLLSDLLSSLQPSGGYRYIIEILACSVPDNNFIKGKGVEVYISIIQHSECYHTNKSVLLRKLDIAKEILEYEGYRLAHISETQIAKLHHRLSNCRFSAATRDSQSDGTTLSGDLDQVISTLINHEKAELEAFSILMWASNKDMVKINTAVFAGMKRRISLIAKSFNTRLKTNIQETRQAMYLKKRLSHLYESRDIAAFSRKNIPNVLPTGKTDSLKDFNPRQAQCLTKDILDNDEGLHLGSIGNRRFTPPLNYLYNMAVLGRSGSGKTSFLGTMIESLSKKGIHYIVLDLFDSDFRALAEMTNAAVFTMGHETSLELNPFAIDGLSNDELREFAKEFIMGTLSFEPPLDGFILNALPKYYKSDVSRNSEDFRRFSLRDYKLNNSYGPEAEKGVGGVLDSRLLKLQTCTSGKNSFKSASLLKNNSIIELAGVSGVESKAIIVSYILHLLMMLKMKAYKSGNVSPTFVFIDEVSALTDIVRASDINIAAQGLKRFLLDIIKRGRKYGLFLTLATQEMTNFESYYQQSHVKVVMNSYYSEQMGYEYLPYKDTVHRLEVGSAICSMPEVHTAFLFKTKKFAGFKKRWDDDMTLSYMKDNFPEYVRDCLEADENASEAKEKAIAPFTPEIEIAKKIAKYIITKLMDPDREKVAQWKESFNIRKFILQVLSEANLSEKLVNEIFVEIIILAGTMKQNLLIDYLKEKQI